VNILLIIYNAILAVLFIPAGVIGWIIAKIVGESEHYPQRLGFQLPPPLD
jgi:hypothetical protein